MKNEWSECVFSNMVNSSRGVKIEMPEDNCQQLGRSQYQWVPGAPFVRAILPRYCHDISGHDNLKYNQYAVRKEFHQVWTIK